MKRYLFCLGSVALALSLTGLMGCGAGSSSDSGVNGSGSGGRKILYSATVGGSTDLYLMNPDGSGQTQVTTDGVAKVNPTLSHDGSKVAYLVREGVTSIYKLMVQSVAGGSPQELPVTLDIPGHVRWAPSGNELIVSSFRVIASSGGGTTRRSAILRVALSGGNQGVVEPAGRDQQACFGPDFSPDGGKIVYVGLQDGSYGIWLMDRDGGNPTEIIPVGGVGASEPRFSPDGKQITFLRGQSSGTARDLYVAARDGSNVTKLVTGGGSTTSVASPTWSPDGTRIVYAQGGRFFSIKADGTDKTPLTPNLGSPATLGQISWK